MKYILVILVALSLGYALYPYLNPATKEQKDEFTSLFHKFLLEEASEYAKSTDPELKLKAAGQMYQKMTNILSSELDLESEKNLSPKISVTVKPEFIQKEASPVIGRMSKNIQDKSETDISGNQTIADKYHANTLDKMSVMTFNELPYLSAEDSRIQKLVGKFEGKVKSLTVTRTGDEERITLNVNQDKSQEMTTAQIIDSYDNASLDLSKKTALSFKSVPGDENLLLMLTPEGSIIFDLRRFPILTGKVFSLNQVKGLFQMEKSRKN